MANDGDSKEPTIEVDLRQPELAAFLAWLWPGAGHLYQRRYFKAAIFMTCILSTYFWGMSISRGHVVYAAWSKADRHWQYACQIGIGLPALPAIVQARRVKSGQEPLWGGFMAPPETISLEHEDELAIWHRDLGMRFELGTLFTMIAGLLNILAICDAYAGPFLTSPEEEAKKKTTTKPPPVADGEGG